MPNPKKYKDKKNWMSNCMHQTVTIENKDKDQGLAQCLNQWRQKAKKVAQKYLISERNKLMSSKKDTVRRVVDAFLKESIIWTDPKKITRLKDRVAPRTEKHSPPTPAQTETENLIPGEIIEVFENGKWVKKPWKPSLKNKEIRLVEDNK